MSILCLLFARGGLTLRSLVPGLRPAGDRPVNNGPAAARSGTEDM